MVLNSRYIFAVSNHALLHGGLGYRPFLAKVLVLGDFSFCSSFSVSYGKHLTLAFLLLVLAILKCLHHQLLYLSQTFPVNPQTLLFSHTLVQNSISEFPEVLDRRLRPIGAWRLRPGRVSAVKYGVSAPPRRLRSLNPGDSVPMRGLPV